MSFVYSPPESPLVLKPWGDTEELFLEGADFMPLLARIQKLAGEYGKWMSLSFSVGEHEVLTESKDGHVDFRRVSEGAFEPAGIMRIFRIDSAGILGHLETHVGQTVKLRIEFKWSEQE